MTTLRPIPTCALDAVIAVPNGVQSIGRALWLYVALMRHASYGGTVIRTQERLVDELGVSESEIAAWLSRLIEAKLVRVQSPFPYLVARLRSWSGEVPRGADLPSNRPAISGQHLEGSYSNSSNKKSSDNTAIAIGEGGAGEGALLKLAREILGAGADEELPAILKRYSEAHVLRVLDRVRNTPPEKIRKSRLAFFRYLIVNTNDHP